MNAIARAILRLYPSAWRERYADEVRAMLESSRVSPGDLIDLALDCLGERLSDVARLLSTPLPNALIDAVISLLLALIGGRVIAAGGRALAGWDAPVSAVQAEQIWTWSLAAVILGPTLWGTYLNLKRHANAVALGLPWPRLQFFNGVAVGMLCGVVAATGVLCHWAIASEPGVGPGPWFSNETISLFLVLQGWRRGLGLVPLRSRSA